MSKIGKPSSPRTLSGKTRGGKGESSYNAVNVREGKSSDKAGNVPSPDRKESTLGIEVQWKNNWVSPLPSWGQAPPPPSVGGCCYSNKAVNVREGKSSNKAVNVPSPDRKESALDIGVQWKNNWLSPLPSWGQAPPPPSLGGCCYAMPLVVELLEKFAHALPIDRVDQDHSRLNGEKIPGMLRNLKCMVGGGRYPFASGGGDSDAPCKDCGKMAGDLKNAERRISELSEVIEERNKEVEKLKGQILEGERVNASLQADLRAKAAELADAQKKHCALGAEVNAHLQKLERNEVCLREKVELERHLTKRCESLEAQLRSEKQHAEETRVQRDRYKTMVEDHASEALLGRGTNIQDSFPTVPELVKNVRQTLTRTVSEWMESFENSADMAFVRGQGLGLATILVNLFRVCEAYMHLRYREIELLFLGKIKDDGQEGGLDPETETFMRRHLRRHSTILFHLSGNAEGHLCHYELVHNAVAGVFGGSSLVTDSLVRGGIGVVVTGYLNIMVGARLQNPVVCFSPDVGHYQTFNAEHHNAPIDGNKVRETCFVVFPAMSLPQEQGKEWMPISKRFVLVDN